MFRISKQNKNFLLMSFLVYALMALFLALPAWAGGAESFEDAVEVLDVAVRNNDLDAIGSLLHEDLGLEVAGQIISTGTFSDLMRDTSMREFTCITEDGITSYESNFKDLLWGDEGVFTGIDEVDLTHFLEIERDDLFDEATMALWEHGELECAVVDQGEGWMHLYIFPDLKYRLSFEEIDGNWYFIQVAVRFE
jgi:hypothetical protein